MERGSAPRRLPPRGRTGVPGQDDAHLEIESRQERSVLALELVVVLAAVVLACEVLARWARVAPPVLLLAAGALLAVVPQLREVHLPPQAVLLLFLPALLWWESLNTSLRDIRRSLRGVVLISTLLVV